jgi:hypothetical protein
MDDDNKTILLEVSLAQAVMLALNAKSLCDVVQSKSVIEARPLTEDEDLLIEGLSWIGFCLKDALEHADIKEVENQITGHKEYYQKELKKQADNN